MAKKTLDQAIGCWTNSPQYNDLPSLSLMVKQAAYRCRHSTKNGDPLKLLGDLGYLIRRIDAMKEVAETAISRCYKIISEKELE